MKAKTFTKMVGVAVVAVVFSGLVIAGCGGDDDPAGPGNRDSGLVTGAGEAWVNCEASYCDGLVFLSNGTYREIWHQSGNDWIYYHVWDGSSHSWSTRGSNELIYTYTEEASYTVSGNTLILGNDGDIFTKTTGLKVEIVGSGGGNSGGSRDSRLVTGAGEAWMQCYDDGDDEEYCWGLMFRSNGDFVGIEWDEEDGIWYGYNDGVSWSTRGNNTIIATFRETVKYALSGEDLTLTRTYYDWEDDVEEQRTYTYTKRTGLTIREYDDEYYKRRADTAKRRNTGNYPHFLRNPNRQVPSSVRADR
jgi:hypothetical protein